jgi:hypothetical protein
MKLEIVWSYPALYDLRSIHWLHGADVDAAIMRLAATGQGNIVQVPDQPSLRILRVRRYRALVRADFRAGTLFVVRIYR